jgi:hypothetical protein
MSLKFRVWSPHETVYTLEGHFELCTNIKDVHGKDIFEGDFVKAWRGVFLYPKEYLVIRNTAGTGCELVSIELGTHYALEHYNNFQIYGNIHKNDIKE